MEFIYNLLIYAVQFALWPSQFFSKKMNLFVGGRKDALPLLSKKIKKEDRTIWFHCASLGEFEQGLPIMEGIKKKLPNHKLIITFFSPSGYEVRKNSSIADAVSYLPHDTPKNVQKFLDIVHPDLVFFVKYEFWPNYLLALGNRQIPTFLISGLFRKDQVFFKFYGRFMRDALKNFEYFFVQNESSKKLLHELGFSNITVSGDTRFDRVSHQIEIDNSLGFMETFKRQNLCVVCGSTWPEDEAVLLPVINSKMASTVKFVIAPHKIDAIKIKQLQSKIKLQSVLYSEITSDKLNTASVLIIDTIGLLTKIYSYADIAFVGGAMGNTGLHNILEPATFGAPIVIGHNYEGFPEAIKLADVAGLYPISNKSECMDVFEKFIRDSAFREKTGMICEHFVNQNTGATQCVMNYLAEHTYLANPS